MGEQLDLWFASKNIGVCWYGIGNPIEPNYNGLEFVIMLAIAKTNENHFRKDYKKSKRKQKEEIWVGQDYNAVSEIVRFAPSACNTQPWLIEYQDDKLSLYRVKGKRGIMPQNKIRYYNCIDVGIMMCFLEVCFKNDGCCFKRELHNDNQENKALDATYFFNG